MTLPQTLFQPRSVAIIGASADPAKLSSIPLRNLRNLGYAGRIYAVNPREKEIAGLPCFPDVTSLPEAPDLAFLVVPGQLAVELATECATRGTKVAVVASTGFAEAGAEGLARQQALMDLRDRYGMRLVGPNTNGIYSAHDRFSLGYNAAHAEAFEPGEVSVVSHSGALFSTIGELLRASGVGLSKFVAVGNEADLDLLDFFEYLVGDETTRTILLVVEAVRDGTRFRSIAQRAHAAGKRVAVLKLGTSAAGAASTAAHSSRLAGNARAYDALFAAAGVGVVDSLEALVLFAQVARSVAPDWRPAGRRLGVVTASGAGGTLVIDAASRTGFAVAELSHDSRERLRQHNAEAVVFNPLDVASFGSSRNTPATAPVIGQDASVDAVVAFVHKLQTSAQRTAYATGIAQSMAASGKPHLAIAPAALPPEQTDLLQQGGVAISSQSGAAFVALKALFDAVQGGEQLGAAVPISAQLAHQRVLNEWDSMDELDAAGVPTVARARVGSADAALTFASRVGGPIVLKGVADGVAHKSDVGLVHLDLEDPAQVSAAHAKLREDLQRLGVPELPTALVAQAMVRGGLEVIAGVTVEPALGQFLLVGSGGRQAEYIDDVRLWSIPVSAERVRADLAQTAVGRILQGKRWSRASSIEELVAILMKLQAYVTGPGRDIRALEINPLSLSEHGATALDALVVRDAA
jgi:acetate---CoA ligase (ADP-forming)